MAETTYYDSPLTGAELDEAFRKLANLDTAAAEASHWADQAQYWAGQAQRSANGALGWYVTAEELRQAYPTAAPGQWALVGNTASLWLWDKTQGAFVDSTGHLYGTTLLLDGWQGEGPYTQTAALTPLDGGPAVTAAGRFVSGPLAEDTGDEAANAALEAALNLLNGATAVTLGDGNVTVTLQTRPAVDLPAVWQIREV